jgi:hypothetical protein
VTAGPVLYLALEDTPRRLQSRMRQLLAESGGVAPADLTLVIACRPLPAGGDAYLVDWLEAGLQVSRENAVPRIAASCSSVNNGRSGG